MAEKEASYETATGGGEQQKPSATILHLPSLTSKPTRAHNNKRLEAESKQDEDSAQPSPNGYYFNVAQKGKLILPTALWILLILAGVAFLGLLASLSRTIDTLDTLVELEQEKEARASISEQLARHAHFYSSAERRHKQKHEATTRRPVVSREHDESPRRRGHNNGDLNELSDSPFRFPAASWFSLPSWTSLEPVRPTKPANQQQPQQQSPYDLVKMMPMPDGVTVEIAGDGNGPMPPVGLISSIVSQVVPMLDSFMGQPPPPARPFGPQVAQQQQQQQQQVPPQGQDSGEDLGAIISAKIDNLNINLNAANSERHHNNNNNNNNKVSSSREEEIKSLESSVDDLVAKLMAQKLARGGGGGELDAPEPPMSGAHHHHHQPHDAHLDAPKVDEIMPVIRLPPPHAHHNLVRPGPPLSPLASLLMGGGGGHPMMPDDSTPVILGAFNSPAEFESMLAGAAGPSRPAPKFSASDEEGAQMILSLSSGETNRHGLSNTKRPSGSPYELSHLHPHPATSGGLMPLLDSFRDLDEMIKRPDYLEIPPAREPSAAAAAARRPKSEGDAKWDVLSNDLADVILQGSHAADKLASGSAAAGAASSGPKSESVVVVNGKQLEGGERDKFLSSIFGPSSGGDGASETKDPLGDLMSAMFEPMRTSATGTTKSDVQEAPKRAQTTAGPGALSPATVVTLEPTQSVAASKIEPELNKSATARPADNLLTDPDAASSPADMVNDLLSTMFALPQFGASSSSQQQASTSGAPPSSGSSSMPGSSLSAGTNSSAPKESMLCECQKVPPARVASGSSSGGRSSPAVAGSRPSSGGSSADSSGGSPSSSGGGGGASSSGGRPSGGSASSSPSSGSGGGRSPSGGSSSSGGAAGRNSGGGSSPGSGGSSGGSSSGGTGGGSSGAAGGRAANSPPQPIGFVPVIGRPDAAPAAFAAPLIGAATPAELHLSAAAQESSSSNARLAAGQRAAPIASHPVANSRPGSLLSALNNSTNNLLPRIINRLNNTNVPSFAALGRHHNSSSIPFVTTLFELPVPLLRQPPSPPPPPPQQSFSPSQRSSSMPATSTTVTTSAAPATATSTRPTSSMNSASSQSLPNSPVPPTTATPTTSHAEPKRT